MSNISWNIDLEQNTSGILQDYADAGDAIGNVVHPANMTSHEGWLVGEDAELMSALTFDVLVLCVCLIVYLVLHALHGSVYYVNPLRRNRGPPPPRSSWEWVGVVLRLSDMELEKHAGLDAVAYALFLRMLLQLFSAFGATLGVIEVAVYLTCSYRNDASYDGTLARLSLANTPVWDGTPCSFSTMVLSMLGVWALSLLTFFFLHRFWRRVIRLRQQYMVDARDASAHALLVIGGGPVAGPQAVEPSTREQVEALWEELYENDVVAVKLVRDTGKLKKLHDKRTRLMSLLAEAEAAQGSTRTRCCVSCGSGCAGCVLPRFDGSACLSPRHRPDEDGAHVKPRLKRLNTELLQMGLNGVSLAPAAKSKLGAKPTRGAKPLRDDQMVANMRIALREIEKVLVAEHVKYSSSHADTGYCYFVLMRSLRAANMARQVLNTPDTGSRVIAAPLPTDVQWSALKPSGMRRAAATKSLTVLLYLLMLFFYSIPISFVSSLISLPHLQKTFPFLRSVVQALGGNVENLLTAVLPALALFFFMENLPTFCVWLASLSGLPSFSETKKYAFKLLFAFQFIWSFLGVAVANGLIVAMRALMRDPSGTLNHMGSSLAATSVFFMTYLTLQICFWLPMKQLVEFSRFSRVLCRRLCGGGDSPNDSAAPRPPPAPPPYHALFVNALLAAAIGLCFANVNAVTLVFALVYLGTVYLLFVRHVLYICTNEHESAGRAFWPAASARLLFVLATGQILMVTLHSIKESYVTAFGVTASLLPTFLFYQYSNQYLVPQLDNLPLLLSVRADVSQRPERSSTVCFERRRALSLLYGPQFERSASNEPIEEGADASSSGRSLLAVFNSFYKQKELDLPVGMSLSERTDTSNHSTSATVSGSVPHAANAANAVHAASTPAAPARAAFDRRQEETPLLFESGAEMTLRQSLVSKELTPVHEAL